MIKTLLAVPFFSAFRRGAIRSSTDLPALRQTAELFHLLLEKSADLIVEATRDGDILYVSPNVPNTLGYQVGDLLHANLFTHVHPEDLAQTKTLFGLHECRATCRYRHKDGSWRWVEMNGREFAGASAPPRSVLVIRDITERKEAESVRDLLQREHYKNATLSALGMQADGIVHDFNNLLTAISGHLAEAQSANREPKVRASLSTAEQAVGRAKNLAEQIPQLSLRQNAGHELVRLPAIVAEVLQLLRPTWPAGVEITTDLPADIGWVMASPIQLHQVFTNLFINAAHAMEPGPGRLEVRAFSVVVKQPYADAQTALSCGRYIQVTVSDTGHGMDAATLQRIFEPFFTTKRLGTGLGLAVVLRVIKEHGACIQVSSEPGKGTTFRLYFVAHPNPPAAGEAN